MNKTIYSCIFCKTKYEIRNLRFDYRCCRRQVDLRQCLNQRPSACALQPPPPGQRSASTKTSRQSDRCRTCLYAR